MKLRYLVPLAFVFAASNASAILITSETTQLPPSTPAAANPRFQTDYTVVNGPTGIAIESLSIIFELGSFENLLASSSPVNWNSIVFQPDPSIPDDGLFDTLALIGSIAPGETLSGFRVVYDFLGTGAPPGAQMYTINNPIDFSVLATGTTTTASSVPEPAMLALLGVGLLGASISRRPRQKVGEPT